MAGTVEEEKEHMNWAFNAVRQRGFVMLAAK